MIKALSFDSGAERMGWASVWKGYREALGTEYPIYHDSGILALAQGDLKFQDYRLMLIDELNESVPFLLEYVKPDVVTTETVPAVGSFGGTQMYLANVACTTVQVIARQHGLPVKQIGATTVHKHMVPDKAKGRKVSKVMVRNGVLKLLPELEPRKKEWVKVFDEVDAIANGLTYHGFEAK